MKRKERGKKKKKKRTIELKVTNGVCFFWKHFMQIFFVRIKQTGLLSPLQTVTLQSITFRRA
jgi:hypothetical protein